MKRKLGINTDCVRGLLDEVAALELIDPDDTPKNIMLRALRRADAGTGTPAEQKALAEYHTARAFLLGK